MPKFFIAIVPPEEVSNEIIKIQNDFKKLYGTEHALKAPPHITVIPPFDCEESSLQFFLSSLSNIIERDKIMGFDIRLNGIERFASRTIFIDVDKNYRLISFCKIVKFHFLELKLIKQRLDKHYFIPHITVANKDISKKNFKEAWEKYKRNNFKKEFRINAIEVFIYQEGNWIKHDRRALYS